MNTPRSWAALLLLTAAPSLLTAQTEIRWKFKPDSRFTLETTAKLNQTVTGGSQELKQNVTFKSRTRYTVVQATAEQTMLEMKVEGFEASLPDGRSMPTAIRQELRDAAFRVKLNPQQQVMQVEGVEEFFQRATAEDPNLQKALQLMLPKDNFVQMAQHAFAYLPEKAVSVGDKWERTLAAPLGPLGSFKIHNTYQLEKPEQVANRLCQRIALRCSITYEAPQNTNLPFAIRGGEFQTTQGEGTIWFDAQAGELFRADFKLALQGKLTVEVQGKTSTLALRQEQQVEVRQVVMEE